MRQFGPGFKRLLTVVLVMVVLFVIGTTVDVDLVTLVGWLEWLTTIGPVPWALGFLLGTMAMLPASVLMGSAGFLYGPVVGAMVGWAMQLLGVTLNFLIARWLLRPAFEHRIRNHATLRVLDRAVAKRSIQLVALLRMCPVFPCNPISYGLGVTQVSLRDYVVGCAIGLIPVVLLNTTVGATVQSLAQLIDGSAEPPSLVYWSAATLTVVASIAVTRLATRFVREAMDEAQRGSSDDGRSATSA